MSYNLTFMDTSNNLLDVFTGINTASGGLVGIALLTMVFVISFLGTVRDGVISALVNSSLLTSIIAIFIGFAGFIDWSIVIVPIMLLFVSLIIKFFQR